MKRIFFLFVVVLAISFSIPSVAKASNYCGGDNPSGSYPGGYSYGGYDLSVPPIGQDQFSVMYWYGDMNTVLNGHTASWVGVADNTRDSIGPVAWMQTGVDDAPGGQTQMYIEYRPKGGSPSVPVHVNVPTNVNVNAEIYHNSNGNWTALVWQDGGFVHAFTYQINGTMGNAFLGTEDWNSPYNTTSCNTIGVNFTQISPGYGGNVDPNQGENIVDPVNSSFFSVVNYG